MIPVTNHGDKRMRKRLGLNRKTVERQAAKAWTDGKKQSEFKGAFRSYLDGGTMQFKSLVRVYKGNIYIFDASNHALITCWAIPNRFKKYLNGRR